MQYSISLSFTSQNSDRSNIINNRVIMNPLISLENQQRLSESLLWKLQNTAYTQFGPEAWSHKGVPFYVTSNPYTVKQYAHTVVGFLRDCMTPESPTPIDASKPIYIMDLGAGTGRFGYLFIITLLSLLSSPQLQKLNFCYVMTDISEKNIDFLQKHPYLKPLIEQGILDFAFYNANQTTPITLINQSKTLTKELIENPIILIANYFFDTIPQDLFKKDHGRLDEGRISISIDPTLIPGEPTANNPQIIPQMQYSFTYPKTHLMGSLNNPELNSLLQEYVKTIPDSTFLFPTGALQTLMYFQELSKNKLFLLAGDQGICTKEQMPSFEPTIARHGTFSISVNYDAISYFFTSNNGSSLVTSLSNNQFVVMSGILGGPLSQFMETETAFRTQLDYFEPCDYWRLINYTEDGWPNPPLEYILLLLKWGNWDPMVFNDYFPSILKQLPHSSLELKDQYKHVIKNVFENFYPVALEEGAFIMNLGVLLYQIQEYQLALQYYNQAFKLMKNDPQLLQNIAACIKAIKTGNEEPFNTA